MTYRAKKIEEAARAVALMADSRHPWADAKTWWDAIYALRAALSLPADGRGYDEGFRAGVEALCREFTRRYGPSSGAALRGLAATLAPSAPKGDAPDATGACAKCNGRGVVGWRDGSALSCRTCHGTGERESLR